MRTGQRVALWNPQSSNVVSAAIHSDGRQIAISQDDGAVRILRLDTDERPIDELVRVAELLSSQRVKDGGLEQLTDEQWQRRYDRRR